MMTVTDKTDLYTAEFSRRFGDGEGESRPWLHSLREAALARFRERGFPTVHDEEWRSTNVTQLADTEFTLAGMDAACVPMDQIRRFRLGGGNEALLVFVNGRFAEYASDTKALPQGVQVRNLAGALAADHPVVKNHFARHADSRRNPFVALNTAFAEQGAFVHIARGVALQTPIHLLFVSCAERRPTMAHPRILIVAEDNSQFCVIEHHVALNDGVYFNNPVTELCAAENVVADHCRVVRESDAAYHIATLQIHQGRHSSVSSHTICFGGAIVRNDINLMLEGEGAEANLQGLYMPAGRQHVDNHLCVEHCSPHTSSREFFRGILDGTSRGVFCGRIIVRPGAQKTDAKQTNMNLLLSPDAQVDTKPQLEIFADDVKCTHGATIGQTDPEALFYLRSRGIREDAARSLLVYAFARESLAHLRDARLRVQLEDVVLSRLPNGELLRGEI